VLIRNRARSPLPLERLRLPAPHLSLFAGEDHHLWTEEVTLTREEEGEAAAIKLGPAPPADLVQGTRISGPRVTGKKSSLLHTFGGLFDKVREW